MGQKPGSSGLNANRIGTKDVWIEGARQLSEEGRLAWLLGEGIRQAFGWTANGEVPVDAAAAKMQLAALVRSAVAPPVGVAPTPSVPNKDGQKLSNPKAKTRGSLGASIPFSWPQVSTMRLNDRSYPVVFIGARQIRGRWASLALGVDLHGQKHILGGRDDADLVTLLLDVARRDLSARNGLLVVTEGNPRLDEATQQIWKGQAYLQHCLVQLRSDLQDHTPAELHPLIKDSIDAVQKEPAPHAKEALRRLLNRFEVNHPGAASRLHRSFQPALNVAYMRVEPTLRRQLQTIGPVRVVWEQANQMGNRSASGLEAIIPGIGPWLERSHRLRGHRALPDLVELLLKNGAGYAPLQCEEGTD